MKDGNLNKPTSELIKELKQDASLLIKQHIDLMKIEIKDEAKIGLETLKSEASDFVDSYIENAKNELKDLKIETKVKFYEAYKNIKFMSIGSLVAQGGFILFLIALALAINASLSTAPVSDIFSWVGPLTVGFCSVLVGFMMIQYGKHELQKQSLIPDHSNDKIKEKQKWITKHHIPGSI